MPHWGQVIRDNHETVMLQIQDLNRAAGLCMGPEGLWVALRHVILQVHRTLHAHLQWEEELFFPPLAKLLGETAAAVNRLREDHRQLRASVSCLMGLAGQW